MKRRDYLIGMGAASAGGGVLLGSGAFSRVESDRYMRIEVAEDPNAYLGLDACDSAHGEEYVEIGDGGHLYVGFSSNAEGGEGVNSDSRTWFDDVVQVCNQGTADAHLYIEADEEWPTVEDGPDAGEPRVDFYLGDGEDRESIVGEDNAAEIELGECHCVGIETNTHGIDATSEETLLEAIDDVVTIVADAEEPDVDPDPDEAYFEVTSLDPTQISVEAGESFDVTATIANVGEAAGEQEVELLVEGNLADAQSLLLEPDEDDDVVFADVSTDDLEAGEYTFAVATENDQATGSLAVDADVPEVPLSDLTYAYYEGIGDELPDFDELEPVATGTPPDGLVSLAPAQQESDYALVFEGTIAVGDRMEPGEYTFVVESDPGSRLLVDGTAVVDPETDEEGAVELEAGTHEFRLEYADPDGAGALALGWTDPYGELLLRIAADDPLRVGDPFDWELEVGERPASKQMIMPDSAVRSIAAGVWPNTNFCFDTTTAAVQYGWRGAFLDYGPMIDYGGGRAFDAVGELLGTQFSVGAVDYPLRFGSATDEPEVEFRGYREAPLPPELHYSVDGHEVVQTVDLAPGAIGLEYTIEIDDPPNEPIYFLTDADADIERSATVGTWDDGVLEVPAGETEIGITITANGGEL